jgi:hypothetical protein
LFSKFYKSYRHKDGYFKWCSSCHKIKTKNKGSNQRIKRTKEYMIEYNKKQNKNINFKLKYLIRSNMKGHLKNIKNGKKLDRTFNYVGCTVEFFKYWMEYNFDNKMNWENKGAFWHIDHIKPCASYNLAEQIELYQCYNWKNLRPLYKKDNIKKSDKLDEELIKQYKIKANQFLKTIEYNIQDNIYSVLLPVVKTHTITN